MASHNSITLVGNLGGDPELRYAGDQPVCNFSLATSNSWSKDGEKHERTEWHRIVVWGKQAESAAEYLRKGSSALILGELRYRDWEDKDGNKRTSAEINASRVTFLGGKGGEQSRAPANNRTEAAPVDDDDIPF